MTGQVVSSQVVDGQHTGDDLHRGQRGGRVFRVPGAAAYCSVHSNG
jgi:hypothetical protein